MPGAKEKLTIRQVNTLNPQAQGGLEFSAMLNPAKYTRSSAVFYTEPHDSVKGVERQKKLAKKAVDKLDLDELVLDGTGIVDAPAGTGDVDTQVNLLRQVLNDPAGDANVVNAVVDVVWGTLVFRGRIASMSVNYTLFDASGTPLRARVKLSFVAYDQSGPMMGAPTGPQTRQIRLVAGHSLPLLCFTAYQDASLFQAVALYNGLTTCRQLVPGTRLTLPKLG
jgi:hypothetical protein